MWLPTQKQVKTATRYAGVIAATSFTLLGLQAKGFDLSSVQNAINATGDTVSTILTLVAAIGALTGAGSGVNAASPANQIRGTEEVARDPTRSQSADAQVALLNATKTVLAAPVTSPGAAAALAQETKAALLDATASLPEVVDPIHVTDQKLVNATISEQVVKAGG